ncbi:hypothetical protein [Thioclava sp. GXIMD4216]|uniref:DoxX-like family protein n=1 Tax=Thioclava litoralis TaxID=3076557 RepID=A0ABZ1DY89_9RHOB|nr:hypothetical protein RPE78_08210 [Thioclava sp. FTW29]
MQLARWMIWAEIALRAFYFPALTAFLAMGRAEATDMIILVVDLALLLCLQFSLRAPQRPVWLFALALCALHYLHAISGGLSLGNFWPLLDGILAAIAGFSLALRKPERVLA